VVGEHSINEGGAANGGPTPGHTAHLDPQPFPPPATAELDTSWIPTCQCGWAFHSSGRSLRIADRTHGFHLDRVHAA